MVNLLRWPPKHPNETIDYSFDWSDSLPEGDTISSSLWALAAGSDGELVLGIEEASDTGTTIWLSGGTDGERYVLTNRITTAEGRIFDRNVIIDVAEPGGALITQDDIAGHLKIDVEDITAEIETKALAAERTVLQYIERPDSGWTSETVPEDIKVAILLVLAHLNDNRGEDGTSDPKSPAVKSILKLWRVPVFA